MKKKTLRERAKEFLGRWGSWKNADLNIAVMAFLSGYRMAQRDQRAKKGKR